MRLGVWPERLLDPDVKLPGAHSEPATATRTQWFGLFEFLQPKYLAEEAAGFGLASLWSRELKMVDISHEHPVITPIFKLPGHLGQRGVTLPCNGMRGSRVWANRGAFGDKLSSSLGELLRLARL